jgi:hypothetical protein
VGKIPSQTISDAQLLRLTVADNGTIVREGSGLSGKVHTVKKGISVHFRYRFDGSSREMPLGAAGRIANDPSSPARVVADVSRIHACIASAVAVLTRLDDDVCEIRAARCGFAVALNGL